MNWLVAWWHQIRGYHGTDPWEDDPRIRAARDDQHQRIEAATRLLAREGLAIRRERRFWERHGGPPPKQHDDG